MSRFGTQDYHIGRVTGTCAATSRKLAVGEKFVAALVDSPETEELVRVDFSMEAWDQGARPERLFGFWRGIVPAPDAKKKVLIDDAAIMDMFEQLAGTTDPKRVAFRFVLALVLIRKRLLSFESSRTGRDGQPSLMFLRRKGDPRPPEGPAFMEVIDPGMTDEAVEEVINQFEAVMAGDDQPEQTPQAAAPQVVIKAPEAAPAGEAS